jgi:hypothetical protein
MNQEPEYLTGIRLIREAFPELTDEQLDQLTVADFELLLRQARAQVNEPTDADMIHPPERE